VRGLLAPTRAQLVTLAALLGAAILSLGLASGSNAAATSPPPPTCQSGRTLFQHGAVRVFHVSFYDTSVSGRHEQVLICRGGSPRPQVLYDAGPFNFVGAGDFAIRGDRLGFVAHDLGFGAGSETDIGWIDLRTGHIALGVLDGGENATLLAGGAIGYAIAPNGTAAVISGTSCQVVAVLGATAKTDTYGYSLGPASVLYLARQGGLERSSIAITHTSVTWRTAGGSRASAARFGRPVAPRSWIGRC
jgi:hypothetical protein